MTVPAPGQAQRRENLLERAFSTPASVSAISAFNGRARFFRGDLMSTLMPLT
jgi:hypothetical protein